MLERLRRIHSPLIKEVRGKGLWAGVEFCPEHVSAREICEKLFLKGVLSKETHGTVVRFAPPLIITKEELDFGLGVFEEVVKESKKSSAI
jgi:ornithine--oxo-acid transaminase